MARKSKYGKRLGRPSSGACTTDQTRRLNALKMAARSCSGGQWPYLKTYGLSEASIQRLMDGYSRNYEVIACQGELALKYNPPE